MLTQANNVPKQVDGCKAVVFGDPCEAFFCLFHFVCALFVLLENDVCAATAYTEILTIILEVTQPLKIVLSDAEEKSKLLSNKNKNGNLHIVVACQHETKDLNNPWSLKTT